jgi:PAS domain S-box-containing protein
MHLHLFAESIEGLSLTQLESQEAHPFLLLVRSGESGEDAPEIFHTAPAAEVGPHQPRDWLLFRVRKSQRNASGGFVTLGRSAENDIVCRSACVSKFHAYIVALEAGGHALVDNTSSNGTFVERRRLDRDERHPLANGDTISLGSCQFTFFTVAGLFEFLRLQRRLGHLALGAARFVVLNGPEKRRVLPMEPEVLLRGSPTEEGGAASAWVERAAGRFVVSARPEGAHLTVNGRSCSQSRLFHGDRVRLGDREYQFLCPTARNPRATSVDLRVTPPQGAKRGPASSSARLARICQAPESGPRFLEAFIALAKAISSAATIPSLLEMVADSLARAVEHERLALFLVDDAGAPGELQATLVRRGPGDPPGARIVVNREAVEQAAAAGACTLVGHGSAGPGKEDGKRSFLCVPILGSTGPLGALYLEGGAGDDPFDEARLDFAATVGRLLGLALERAHLDAALGLRAEALERELRERERTEGELRESEARFRTIANSAQDAIILLDGEGRIVFWNQASEKIFGYSSKEALGRDAHHLLAPAGLREPHEAGFQIFRRTGAGPVVGHILELMGLRKDGAEVPIELSVSAIQEKGAWCAIGIARDISVRKRDEAALRASHARLEETLGELRQAQEQIVQQERLRALGHLASGIAHDFNNSLMTILGHVELLFLSPERLDDRADLLHTLEIIDTAAQDAAAVVRRLREFYRPRLSNEAFSPVFLDALLEEVVELTRPRWDGQARAEGVELRLTTERGQVPPVEGNEAHLRQALMNLVLNAIAASPRGGEIRLSTERAGECVVLRIRDQGEGMSDEVRRRCLEPFFTTKGARGSGLGLSIVYGIVQRHGGRIEIESNPGKGACFTITLPLREEAAPAAAAPQEPARAGGPLRVLVIEDDERVRTVAARFLERAGHRVETACDGQQGLARFRAERFDLVVTDRAMPGMSGDQVAEAVKALAPEVPVIMLTGFADMMETAGEMPHGVDFLLPKPLTWSGLQGALAKCPQASGEGT